MNDNEIVQQIWNMHTKLPIKSIARIKERE
jgi:hypothetical protein